MNPIQKIFTEMSESELLEAIGEIIAADTSGYFTDNSIVRKYDDLLKMWNPTNNITFTVISFLKEAAIRYHKSNTK